MSVKIYYDGLCHLCSREIEHYRHQAGSKSLEFIDITSSSFDAVQEGLDPYRVHREMHVRTRDGALKTGIDAFIEIWEQLPRYHWAAGAAKRKFPKIVLDFFYGVFARIRPLLPRKKDRCGDSPYCRPQRQ